MRYGGESALPHKQHYAIIMGVVRSPLCHYRLLHEPMRMHRVTFPLWLLSIFILTLTSCSVLKATVSTIKTGYRVTKSTVKGTVWTVRETYQFTKEATNLVYHIGEFTFEVVRAPLDVPLVRDELQTIDGLPVTEAIRLGRVKTAPYTINGSRYIPMTVTSAQIYEKTG